MTYCKEDEIEAKTKKLTESSEKKVDKVEEKMQERMQPGSLHQYSHQVRCFPKHIQKL